MNKIPKKVTSAITAVSLFIASTSIVSCGNSQKNNTSDIKTAKLAELRITIPNSILQAYAEYYLNQSPETEGVTHGTVYNDSNDYMHTKVEVYDWFVNFKEGTIEGGANKIKASIKQSLYAEFKKRVLGRKISYRKKIGQHTTKADGKLSAKINLEIDDWVPKFEVTDYKWDIKLRHNILSKIGAIFGGIIGFIIGCPETAITAGAVIAEKYGKQKIDDIIDSQIRAQVDEINDEVRKELNNTPLLMEAAIAVRKFAAKNGITIYTNDIVLWLQAALRIDFKITPQETYLSLIVKESLKDFALKQLFKRLTNEQKRALKYVKNEWPKLHERYKNILKMREIYLRDKQETKIQMQAVAKNTIETTVSILDAYRDIKLTELDKESVNSLTGLLENTRYDACSQPSLNPIINDIEKHIKALEREVIKYQKSIEKIIQFPIFEKFVGKHLKAQKLIEEISKHITEVKSKNIETEQCSKYSLLHEAIAAKVQQAAAACSSQSTADLLAELAKRKQVEIEVQAKMALKSKLYTEAEKLSDRLLEEYDKLSELNNADPEYFDYIKGKYDFIVGLIEYNIDKFNELSNFPGVSQENFTELQAEIISLYKDILWDYEL